MRPSFELTHRKVAEGGKCHHTATLTHVGHPETFWTHTETHDDDEYCDESQAHADLRLGMLLGRDERFQKLITADAKDDPKTQADTIQAG